MRKPQVGQWVRVMYDDVGAVDAIYVGEDRILKPFDNESMSLNGAPIVLLGKRFEAKDSGLYKKEKL